MLGLRTVLSRGPRGVLKAAWGAREGGGGRLEVRKPPSRALPADERALPGSARPSSVVHPGSLKTYFYDMVRKPQDGKIKGSFGLSHEDTVLPNYPVWLPQQESLLR